MKITRVVLPQSQTFARAGAMQVLQPGGIRGASAAFELELDELNGVAGVFVKWHSGQGFIPLTSCSRVDFEAEPEPARRSRPRRKRVAANKATEVDAG